jgi:hypothetical protein
MDYDLNQKCGMHEDRYDCPDALINTVRGGYGLIVHDGGSSVIEIGFCPWCGSKLPKIGDIPTDPAALEDIVPEAPDGIPGRVLDFAELDAD